MLRSALPTVALPTAALAPLVALLAEVGLLTAEDSVLLGVVSFACFVRVVVLALELVETLIVVAVVVVGHESPVVVLVAAGGRFGYG